jgi:ketosteroid isomerase-like protein
MSEEIKALERERLEAMGRNDVAALDGLLADGLLYLHSTGDRDGKEALLGQIGDGTIVYRRVTPHEPEVHMLGDTAILFGHIDADVTRAGADRTLDYDYLAVWAKADGRWQFFAYQPRP